MFNEKLGLLKDVKITLHVCPDSQPKYYKPRAVPFVLKEGIEKELDRLQALGVITKVKFSEWAVPIVPVVKNDKSIRLCGDYKLTINAASDTETYSLPRIDEMFASLSGGTTFTKLDLRHAYQQLALDEQSQKLVTINTHRGLFQYTRLPFGVASAPARTMGSLMQGLPGVCVYLDDILVSRSTNEEHLSRLDSVLCRLEQGGLRLKKEKCVFMVPM